jgi:hypothetical protein
MDDRCQAGDRCRMRDAQTGLAYPQHPLCQWELEAAERDTRALVLDYRDLEQQLPPSLGSWSDGQRRGKSTPLPIRGHVLDLQIEIHWVTSVWADVLRDRERLSDLPGNVRDGWAVQRAVTVLAPRLHLLAEVPPTAMWDYPTSTPGDRCTEVPGWQGVLDLMSLHQRARSALGLTNALPNVAWGVLCRGCDRVSTLVQEPGSDERRCSECHEHYSAMAYADWVALLAAAEKRRGAAA